MADVKKINGYNIKDASARSDISSLDTRIDTLEATIDTPSTGLTDRVGALESSIDTPSTGLSARVDELEDANNYSSTDEVICGKWIDNRPIYRKIFEINSLPTAGTEVSYPTSITDIDYVINLYGVFKGTGEGHNSQFPANFYVSESQYEISTRFMSDTSSIRILSEITDNTSYSGYVTIEYVKVVEI